MDLTIYKPLGKSGAEQKQSYLTHSHGCNCQKTLSENHSVKAERGKHLVMVITQQ